MCRIWHRIRHTHMIGGDAHVVSDLTLRLIIFEASNQSQMHSGKAPNQSQNWCFGAGCKLCRIRPQISHIYSLQGCQFQEAQFQNHTCLYVRMDLWLIRPWIRHIWKCFLNLLFVTFFRSRQVGLMIHDMIKPLWNSNWVESKNRMSHDHKLLETVQKFRCGNAI